MSRAWRCCLQACLTLFPAVTINRLCASGLNAVGDAARAIRTGEMDFAIAGGVESMTRAPYVMGKATEAFSRSGEIFDTTLGWRFINPLMKKQYGVNSMAETAENVAQDFQVERKDQDAFALRSQQRAAAAIAKGYFAKEIVPVEIAGESRPDRGQRGRALPAGYHHRELAEAQADRARGRHSHRRQRVRHQ